MKAEELVLGEHYKVESGGTKIHGVLEALHGGFAVIRDMDTDKRQWFPVGDIQMKWENPAEVTVEQKPMTEQPGKMMPEETSVETTAEDTHPASKVVAEVHPDSDMKHAGWADCQPRLMDVAALGWTACFAGSIYRVLSIDLDTGDIILRTTGGDIHVARCQIM